MRLFKTKSTQSGVPWEGNYSKRRNALIEKSIKAWSEGSLSRSFSHFIQLNAPYGLRLDERVIEVPWAASKMFEKKVILDAGCAFFKFSSTRQMLSKDQEIHLLTLDKRDFPAGFDSNFVKLHLKDLREGIGLNEIDLIICISTLEHIGLNNTLLYSNDPKFRESSPRSYLEAVEVLIDSLKIGGEILLTVPYGLKANLKWLQIFDQLMVEEIADNPRIECMELLVFKHVNGKGWQTSDLHDSRDARYYDYHADPKGARKTNYAAAEAVVLLHLRKKVGS